MQPSSTSLRSMRFGLPFAMAFTRNHSTKWRGAASVATEATNQASGGMKERAFSHEEEWMVNLRNETWLYGDRPKQWFTGMPPSEVPGSDGMGRVHALKAPLLTSVTRKQARDYFDNSWTMFETLFAGFHGEEGFYRPPVHGLRHPQIFYYGHTPCLYVNKMLVAGILDKPVHQYFESIFEVGVDEMLWDDMQKNDMVWPTVEEVRQYRRDVYDTVVDAIDSNFSDTAPRAVTKEDPLWSVFMGVEHEKIHLETSSVLFRETPLHLMQVPSAWPSVHPSASNRNVAAGAHPAPIVGQEYPQNELLPVSGGSVKIGKPHDHPTYGWDNEYGSRTMQVPDFLASKYMISNGEMFEFVADRGYATEKYWTEEGWGWRRHRNMKWPFFWDADGPAGSNRFKLRTVFEQVPMQWDWPCEVNLHEARAFCAWKSENDGVAAGQEYRVLTEAEHHLLRADSTLPERCAAAPETERITQKAGHEYSEDNGDLAAANTMLNFASSSPVNAHPPSPTGHYDVMGNAWEWTEDHFNPLDGFEIHRVYDDFSTPCFDGKHNIIMGGSWVSSGDLSSAFARYHFRPHFLQHSGFRIVQSAVPHSDVPATHLTEGYGYGVDAAEQVESKDHMAGTSKDLSNNVYETKELVDMYLGLHYDASGEDVGVPAIIPHENAPVHALRFPQRCADLLLDAKPEISNARALDIGCAVGGTSFALASDERFNEVIGIDFSAAFVEAAIAMGDPNRDPLQFNVPTEGGAVSTVTAKHFDGVDAAAMSKCRFQVGDACNLPINDLGTFDGIVAANLLCRLPDPAAFLDALPKLLNRGGVAALTTPFSWLEEFTPRNNWIRPEDFQGEMEARGMELVKPTEPIALTIREHTRKYQYIVAEASVWRKI